MGFEIGRRAWQRPTEVKVERNELKTLNTEDLIERNRVQAINFIKNEPNLAAVFKGQDLHEKIVNSKNRMRAARSTAANNPQFHLEKLGYYEPDEQATFLIALAEELQKPEYNQ